jgi:hypothetical protein
MSPSSAGPSQTCAGSTRNSATANVLRTEYGAAHGRTRAAAAATRDAIEAGVPLFADGLSRLLDALVAYRIDHDNAPLLSRIYEDRVADSLWTLWRPGRLTPGKLLVP